MNAKMRRMLRSMGLLLLPLFAGGCMTQKLWSDSALDDWNEPAPASNLHLFDDRQRQDFLVVYDEYSERHCSTHTRGFFLNQNQDRLSRHLRPRFVKVDHSASLQSVPMVFGQPPVSFPAGFCVVTTTNVPVFTLYSNGHELGAYELPVYSDGIGRAEQVALTPVAAKIDATVFAGAGVVIGFYVLAESNFQWRP